MPATKGAIAKRSPSAKKTTAQDASTRKGKPPPLGVKAIEEVVLDLTASQHGPAMGRLVEDVRRELSKRKHVASPRDEVRLAIEHLVETKRLGRHGHHLFRIEVVEEPRTSKRDAPLSEHEENRCYFPLKDGSTTFDAVREAIAKRFEVVARDKAACRFRWRYADTDTSPTFTLTLGTVEEFERVMTAKRNPLSVLSKSYAVLSFDNLDEVLDDINGLIEAQGVIQRVTKGPMFLAWNGERVDP